MNKKINEKIRKLNNKKVSNDKKKKQNLVVLSKMQYL